MHNWSAFKERRNEFLYVLLPVDDSKDNVGVDKILKYLEEDINVS
jgi:hypothetical protein